MEQLVDTWLHAATQDAFILRASAGLDHCITIASSNYSWTLVLANDAVQVEKDGSAATRPTVEIRANDQTWEKLLTAETVEPGWQGFGAIKRFNSAFSITGEDFVIAQCLPILERLIELTYGHLPIIPAPAVELDPTQIHGNYSVIKTASSGEHLVYWESAGKGAPVLFLHTAGADARQYRHQLSDVALASDRTLFAFDMPGHGRSDMPQDWVDGKPYELSLVKYLEVCAAFIEQVIGEPVVVAGCSMGAAMSLVIAARRPDLVKGVIALEAPWRSPGRKSPLLRDARVNPSLHNPAYVRGMMGPQAPRRYREEACWIYSQAGFGVYAGDLGFYSEQFDGEVIGAELQDTPIPIQLLTGEYDYSASPENTQILARLINTAEFKSMPGLGHFPMIEHPLFFRPYLMEALNRIDERNAQRFEESCQA